MSMMKTVAAAAIAALMGAGGASAETYSQTQLQEIFEKSPNAEIRHYAAKLAGLAIARSGGDSASYNGSCCSGLFQISGVNLAHVGLTSQQFRRLSPLDQVAVYIRIAPEGDSDLDADALRKLRIESVEVRELAPPNQAADPARGRKIYTQAEIREMFAASSNRMVSYKSAFLAAEAMKSSQGDPAAFNGTCCSGLMQVNNSNLREHGNITGAQYRAMSGPEQIAIWVKAYEAGDLKIPD